MGFQGDLVALFTAPIASCGECLARRTDRTQKTTIFSAHHAQYTLTLSDTDASAAIILK